VRSRLVSHLEETLLTVHGVARMARLTLHPFVARRTRCGTCDLDAAIVLGKPRVGMGDVCAVASRAIRRLMAEFARVDSDGLLYGSVGCLPVGGMRYLDANVARGAELRRIVARRALIGSIERRGPMGEGELVWMWSGLEVDLEVGGVTVTRGAVGFCFGMMLHLGEIVTRRAGFGGQHVLGEVQACRLGRQLAGQRRQVLDDTQKPWTRMTGQAGHLIVHRHGGGCRRGFVAGGAERL